MQVLMQAVPRICTAGPRICTVVSLQRKSLQLAFPCIHLVNLEYVNLDAILLKGPNSTADREPSPQAQKTISGSGTVRALRKP
jgi:hypothetical protein